MQDRAEQGDQTANIFSADRDVQPSATATPGMAKASHSAMMSPRQQPLTAFYRIPADRVVAIGLPIAL